MLHVVRSDLTTAPADQRRLLFDSALGTTAQEAADILGEVVEEGGTHVEGDGIACSPE